MKNSLQGINSRVDEAKNQTSDLEYKDAKIKQNKTKQNKTLNQNNKNKTELSKQRIVYKEPLEQLQAYQHLHDMGSEEEKSQKLKTYLKKWQKRSLTW